MNKQERYFQIISNYKQELINFNEKLKSTNFKCVFNNQLIKDDLFEHDIKAIVIMDNPGKEEYEQNEYLVGTAGKAFNKVIKSIGLNRNEVLVFNKSAITTPATLNLNKIYENEFSKKIFLEEQEFTYKIIKEISLLLDIPILLHGYAAYFKGGKAFTKNEKSNRPLYIFFKNLKNDLELKQNAHFYKHSSYGNLSKQISAYSKELNLEQLNFKQYLNLGKKNIDGFF